MLIKKKLIVVNLLVFASFILLLEILNRVFLFSISCRGSCDYKYLTFKPYRDSEKKLNRTIFKKDEILGYTLNKNISVKLRDKIISTDEFGLRRSYSEEKFSLKILTIGDSFAFGWEVSDKDTWQECLNKNIKGYHFLNGGVGGYGTGQSILRAKEIYPKLKPNGLLVQTLVGSDFDRDQINKRMGVSKPYFIKSNKNPTKIVYPFHIDKSLLNKSSFQLLDKFIVNFTLLNRFEVFPFVPNIYTKV